MSSGLIVLTISIVLFSYTWAKILGFISLIICIYWAMAYRKLGS